MKINVFEADRYCEIIEPMLKDAKGITAYALSRNLRLLKTELTEFHVAKLELFKKYGTEKDGLISIDKNSVNYEQFLKEMTLFNDENIDVDLRMIKESDLISSGLNGEQMYLLSFLEER